MYHHCVSSSHFEEKMISLKKKLNVFTFHHGIAIRSELRTKKKTYWNFLVAMTKLYDCFINAVICGQCIGKINMSKFRVIRLCILK